MGNPTDEELMARFQAGDVDSFASLATRYSAPLLHLATRYLGRREDGEEVRQETLLRAFSRGGSFRSGARFRPWIYRITLNLCRDRNRRRRRLTWISLSEESSLPRQAETRTAVQGERVVEGEDRARVLKEHLRELPEAQRTVLILKEFEEMTFREISETLDCPESTVKSRLYSGLSALRSRMEPPPTGSTPDMGERPGGM